VVGTGCRPPVTSNARVSEVHAGRRSHPVLDVPQGRHQAGSEGRNDTGALTSGAGDCRSRPWLGVGSDIAGYVSWGRRFVRTIGAARPCRRFSSPGWRRPWYGTTCQISSIVERFASSIEGGRGGCRRL